MWKTITNLISQSFPTLMSNWQMLLSIAGVCFLLGSWSGWKVHGLFYDANELKNLKVQVLNYQAKEVAAAKTSASLEAQLAASRTKNSNLNKLLGKERAKNHIYASCIVPVDGLHLRNSVNIRNTAR
jgi:hypothetical protein